MNNPNSGNSISFCPECGNKIPQGGSFCEHCGTPIEKQEVTNFCSECGARCNPEEVFCQKCGTPLKAHQQPQYAPQQPIQRAPRSSNRGLVAGIAVIVLLIGIIIAGWFSFGRDLLRENLGNSQAPIGDTTDVAEATGEEQANDDEVGAVQEEAQPKQYITLSISHVDVSEFPRIKCYVNITDENGVTLQTVDAEDFDFLEILGDGSKHKVTVKEMLKASESEGMSINLVMDRSGSMEDYGFMFAAQTAAHSLITEIQKNNKDFVSITAFENYVSVLNEFTQDYEALHRTIDDLSPGGGTALYDALYSALMKTNEREGAKCVIAFTDGLDNESSYTYEQVVELSKQTSIPIYIIGLGQDFSAVDLQQLATDTNGYYYGIEGGDTSALLAQIYRDIYQNQLEQFVFTCDSSSTAAEKDFRTIEVNCTETSSFEGSANREYVPKPEIVDQYLAEEGVHRYDIIVEDATWTEAQEECERRGGYLVRINTDEEYKAILKQIEAEVDGRKQFFIGAARNPSYEEYYWVYENGRLGTERINNNPKYDAYWLAGEPSYTDIGSGMMETRMVLLQPAGSNEWVWNDIPDNLIGARETISTKMGYICEYED